MSKAINMVYNIIWVLYYMDINYINNSLSYTLLFDILSIVLLHGYIMLDTVRRIMHIFLIATYIVSVLTIQGNS